MANVWINDPKGHFSKGDIQGIHLSFDRWQSSLQDYIVFQYVDGPNHKNLIEINTISYSKFPQSCVGKAFSSPFKLGGKILIPYDVKPFLFHLTMLHEIGHILNLDHQANSIMEPSGFNSRTITCNDVKQFCKVNVCNYQEFTVCKS